MVEKYYLTCAEAVTFWNHKTVTVNKKSRTKLRLSLAVFSIKLWKFRGYPQVHYPPAHIVPSRRYPRYPRDGKDPTPQTGPCPRYTRYPRGLLLWSWGTWGKVMGDWEWSWGTWRRTSESCDSTGVVTKHSYTVIFADATFLITTFPRMQKMSGYVTPKKSLPWSRFAVLDLPSRFLDNS